MNTLTYILQMKDGMSATLSRVGANTESTTQEVRELKGEVSSLNKISLGGFFSKMTRIGSMLGVGILLGKTVKAGMEQEMRNTSFEVLFGGVENAKKTINEISNYAANSPYGKVGLSEATQMMAGFGIAQDKIIPNLKMIGDIAMGDAQKFQSLSLAFSQMSSAGKLNGQDLLQMINAGFNPLNQISLTTGKSISQLRDEMEKGSISAAMVEKAFQDATGEGGLFHDMVNRINNTTSGQWSKAIETISEKLLNFYKNVLQPIIFPALQKFNQFLEDPVITINRLVDTVTSRFPVISTIFIAATAAVIGYRVAMFSLATLQVIIAGLRSALVAYEIVVFAVKNATNLWTAAQWLLNVAFNANPIGIVVGAIVALIAVITLAWNKLDWFRGGITGVWDTFKLFVKFLRDSVLNTIKGLVDTFSGLGKIIKGLFSLDWDSVKSGAKQAASGYVQGFIGGGAITSALENGKKIGETWSKGYESGVANNNRFDPLGWASGKLKNGISTPGIPGNGSGAAGTNNLLGGAAGNGNGAGRETANSIATGGTKTTHITITLDNLVETVNINKNGFRESAENMRDIVLDEMTRVLAMAQGQI